MKSLVAFLILCATSWAQESVPVSTLETEADSISYDVAPWPIEGKCPLPEYPKLAKMAGVQGVVTISLGIDSLGRVVSHRITAAIPEELGFEKEVAEACTSWVFSPAIRNGNPVDTRMNMSFQFRMRDCRSYETDYSCIETEKQAYIDSLQTLRNRNPSQAYSPPPVVEAINWVKLDTNGNH